ncbi:MAG TPA: APC family permease [Parvularculaceae bacterium]|nr:APC family permease [Amphiplicatus sp.]HPE32209.1 APC family permease [Parvularculaceae bacterium]HRX38764.1 APC family permease [Parvularculaceae bacterium]
MENQQPSHQREALERSIPFGHYIAIGVGVIVGVGWVVYSGQWLQEGGPLGAMLAFALGGLLLLPVGYCYAELTSALPLAGGELSFSYFAFGKLAGFLTAWALALNYVFITPFETIAIGTLMETLIPGIATDALYFVGSGGADSRVALSTIIPGLIIGVLLLWLNYSGAKSSTRFQLILVYGMIACTIVFTGAALLKGDVSNLHPLFAAHEGTTGWAAIGASIVSVLVVVPFFMAGFDTIPQAAEESGAAMNPRQLGVAILISILAGTCFYVLIILAVSISMPWTVSSKLPMTTAAVFKEAFGYEWAAKLVIFTAVLGLISTLNGMYIAASRLIFSLGRGGLLPHWFAGVHPVHHTPVNALLFVGAISLIGPFIGKWALIPIVNCNSFVFTIALAVTCASAIKLRMSAPDLARPYRANTLLLYAGLIVSLLILALMIAPNSPGRIGDVELTIAAGWMGFGLIAYVWRQATKPMPRGEMDYMILGDFASSRQAK